MTVDLDIILVYFCCGSGFCLPLCWKEDPTINQIMGRICHFFKCQKGDAEKTASLSEAPSPGRLLRMCRWWLAIVWIPSCHGCESSTVFIDSETRHKKNVVRKSLPKFVSLSHFFLYHLFPFHHGSCETHSILHPRMIYQNGSEGKAPCVFFIPRCLPVWGQSL